MNKKNSIAYSICFALPVLYYIVQGFISKSYFFAVPATAIFGYFCFSMYRIIQNAGQPTGDGRWFLVERETNLRVGCAVGFLTCYYCFFGVWEPDSLYSYDWMVLIIVFLVLGKIIDSKIKLPVLAIHLKAVIALLLFVVVGHWVDLELYNFQIIGVVLIIFVTYLTAMKRTLRRGTENQYYLAFKGLYRCSAIVMACWIIFSSYRMDMTNILMRGLPTDIRIGWIIMVPMVIMIVLMMLEVTSLAVQCTGWSMLLGVLYYFSVVKGFSGEFSFIGIVVACLTGEYVVEMLYKSNIIHSVRAVPVFYALYIPAAYVIANSFAKGRYLIIAALIVMLLLFVAAVKDENLQRERRMWETVLLMPYLILVLSYRGLVNEKAFWIIAATVIVVFVYLRIANGETGIPSDKKQYTNGQLTVLAVCIMLPLLLIAKYEYQNQKYVNVEYQMDGGVPSVGSMIEAEIKGFEDVKIKSVEFDWGKGETEIYKETVASTTIKSNYLTVTILDDEENVYTYHRLFPLWNFRD